MEKQFVFIILGFFLLVALFIFLRQSNNFYHLLADEEKRVSIDKQVLKRIIISTDNSTTSKFLGRFPIEQDDGLALAVLLKAHREGKLEILGITSTFGNTNGEKTYRITKEQVKLSGVDIPIIQGALHSG